MRAKRQIESAIRFQIAEYAEIGGRSIPNARLCKALLDRITDRAHILETGTESYRFRRTAEKQKKGGIAN
jgi:IstB-like ATP binding protein